MARIRTVKPEMAQDEDLAACSAWAQLLAVRLLNQADDEGYFKANPALIKSNCFPLIADDSLNIHGVITELSNIGYISLHDGSDGRLYGFITNFTRHQKINRPTPSHIKDLVSLTEFSVSAHGVVSDDSLGKGRKGKEGTAHSRTNASRFAPPTLDEVRSYCQERGNGVDPHKWHDFYCAKGWMVGRNKMKDWRAAVRTWEEKNPKPNGSDYGKGAI